MQLGARLVLLVLLAGPAAAAIARGALGIVERLEHHLRRKETTE